MPNIEDTPESTGVNSETNFIWRGPGSDNPAPPEFQDLPTVPVWMLQGEKPNPALRPTPEQRHKQLFAAIVYAAISDSVDPEALARGRRPSTRAVFENAGLAVRMRGERQLSRDLFELPFAEFHRAYARSQEINWPPRTPWPRQPRPARSNNSYQRFMDAYQDLMEQEGVIGESYFSWGNVCDYYQGAPVYSTGGPESADSGWGKQYVKNAQNQVSPNEHLTLTRTEREFMEGGFLNLTGVPYLDKPSDVKSILEELPPGTPALCLTSGQEAIAVRTGPEAALDDLEPRLWTRQMVLILNLIMLKSLRHDGRPVPHSWIERTSGYTERRMETNMDSLLEQLGRQGIGLLTNKKTSQDQKYQILRRAFVLDARPLYRSTAEQSDETLPPTA